MTTDQLNGPARAVRGRGALGGTLALMAFSFVGACTMTTGPSPSGGPGPTATVRELTGSPAPLPAGTYTVAAFKPAVTLDLDGSWTSVARFDDFFNVEQNVATPDVIAVLVARPSRLIGGNSSLAPATDPIAAVAALRSNPKLTILEEHESRIGGLTGREVSIENTSGEIVGVLIVDAGVMWVDTDRRLRLAFVPTPDGLVTIVVGSSVTNWDHALSVAEPVLESIRIGG